MYECPRRTYEHVNWILCMDMIAILCGKRGDSKLFTGFTIPMLLQVHKSLTRSRGGL